MRDKQQVWLSSILSFVSLTTAAPGALACGPFFDEPVFSCTIHPDLPLARFAAGDLGIIGPDFARSYLVVAYRYLNAKPLNAAEQKGVLALWQYRLLNGDSSDASQAAEKWQIASNRVLGSKSEAPYPDKSFSSGDIWFSYTNCTKAAFETAVENLNTLSAKYGKTSQPVKDWTKAQNGVFCNCSSDPAAKKPTVPAPQNAKDPELKAYRDYQIAAAYLYSEQFDKARQAFTAIAANAASPFHAIAPYLVVRSMVRQAVLAPTNNLKLLAEAKKKLQPLLNDPQMKTFKPDLENLNSYIQSKLVPEQCLTELGGTLSTPAKDGTRFGMQVGDYTTLFDTLAEDKKPAPSLQADPLSEWITVIQDVKGGKAKAQAKWKETKSLPWLAAALALSSGRDQTTGSLIEAAGKVSKSSPGFLHMKYHQARLLVESGQAAKAEPIIAQMVADPKLLPSAHNDFVELQLQIAKNFDQFKRSCLQRPAVMDDGGFGVEIPVDFEKVWAQKSPATNALMFSHDTSSFFNSKVPVSLLAKLADAEKNSMPQKVRLDAAQSAFCRAVLLGKPEAVEAATKLQQIAPDMKAQLVEFARKVNKEEQLFTAVLLILRNPGMRPLISYGTGRRTPMNKIDDYQDNWWSSPLEQVINDDEGKPVKLIDYSNCLSADERSAGLEENKRLAALGAAVTWLPARVISYSRHNPGDPRVPEALALAIRVTRFAEHTDQASKLSKQCFDILHKKYPKNSWTAKSKFWY